MWIIAKVNVLSESKNTPIAYSSRRIIEKALFKGPELKNDRHRANILRAILCHF
tara:strand:+ start:62 stop:223 length:162 start_codon:yes stop_codon:yes gene_type:complete